MNPYRERPIEIRWIGDAVTDAAAIEALGYPSLHEADDGVCERWLQVPVSRADRVRQAIVEQGGRVLGKVALQH